VTLQIKAVLSTALCANLSSTARVNTFNISKARSISTMSWQRAKRRRLPDVNSGRINTMNRRTEHRAIILMQTIPTPKLRTTPTAPSHLQTRSPNPRREISISMPTRPLVPNIGEGSLYGMARKKFEEINGGVVEVVEGTTGFTLGTNGAVVGEVVVGRDLIRRG